MFSYKAYGLHIQSEIELPELVAYEGEADVTIRFGKVERLPAEVNEQFHSFWTTTEETCLYFQGTGAFLVRHGNEVVIDPVPNVQEQVLRLGVLGPSLSMLLHQRGLLVLHGSAIAIDGKAVSFLGHSGDGKSTMAGSLNRRGHSLVADDLSVVTFEPDGPMLLPGFPMLKLWPEAVTSLGDNPEDLAQLHPLLEKRARKASGFHDDMLPLHRVYLLEDSDELAIEPVPAQTAFVELVRYSHNALLLQQTGTSALHFRQCARLLSSMSLYRLKRPRKLTSIPDVAQFVEAHSR